MKEGRRLRVEKSCHRISPSARTIRGVLACSHHPGRARARPIEERDPREVQAGMAGKTPRAPNKKAPADASGAERPARVRADMRQERRPAPPSMPSARLRADSKTCLENPMSSRRSSTPGRPCGAGQAYRSFIPTVRSAPASHRILPSSFRSPARGLALPSPAAPTADRELGPSSRPSPCPEGSLFDCERDYTPGRGPVNSAWHRPREKGALAPSLSVPAGGSLARGDEGGKGGGQGEAAPGVVGCQAGSLSRLGELLRSLWAAPVTVIRKISRLPARLEVYAIQRPSGDHAGL